MGEIDIPLMRRHVRTLAHVAHVAQIALVDDFPVILLVDPVHFKGFTLIDNPAANWLYGSEPEPNTGGRRIPVPRGKLLRMRTIKRDGRVFEPEKITAKPTATASVGSPPTRNAHTASTGTNTTTGTGNANTGIAQQGAATAQTDAGMIAYLGTATGVQQSTGVAIDG